MGIEKPVDGVRNTKILISEKIEGTQGIFSRREQWNLQSRDISLGGKSQQERRRRTREENDGEKWNRIKEISNINNLSQYQKRERKLKMHEKPKRNKRSCKRVNAHKRTQIRSKDAYKYCWSSLEICYCSPFLSYSSA